MSLDKAIEHGKEHRKPYYKKAQKNSLTCRCHGGCPYCENNRKIQDKRNAERVKYELGEVQAHQDGDREAEAA